MQILYPPLTLIGLTLFCIFRLGYLRYTSVRSGSVDLRFFERFQGYEEPDRLRVHSRHVSNLFEVPVLFYAITVIAYASGVGTILMTGLAWLFVALRFAHTYVHLTSNVVILRFRLFAASLLVLTLLWAFVIASLVMR